MRVLVVTNAYPSDRHPAAGVFVAEQVKSVRAAGVATSVLHVERTDRGLVSYARLAPLVRRVASAEGADLVHVTYGGIMAAVVTEAVRSRPVLVSFCGTDLLGSPEEPLARRAIVGAGVVASRRAARRAAGIVVKSAALRRALPASIGADRVWIVPSGVDLTRFKPLDRDACRERLGWSDETAHILFPADPARAEKRYWLAADAASDLRNRGRDVELHTLGTVPHQDIPLWLNASDAVVLTSTHEGSPNAVKEALACGIPVVSVDVGDVRELIGAVEGCAVADATSGAIADGLERVLAGLRRIDAGSQLAELSLERTAEKLIEIYESLIRSALERTKIPTRGADRPPG